jgi:dihydrofolate synthase/folylpolyglutamate synthase
MELPSVGPPPAPEIRFLYDLRRGSTRLGLASTRRLLRALGHPERAAPMLHVAGTNGKGSTTALAAAMLQAGGLRVGRYTSPHVLHVEERICIDGLPMDAATLRARVRDLRPLLERTGVSFFEAMTALAAVHFRDEGIDVAVYEVGLGGRLDATNALPSAASIISSIGHDHEHILGRGLRAVCREKLGIVRRGVPLFAALDRADLVAQARAHCAARRAPFTPVPADAGHVLDLDLETGTRCELRWPLAIRLRTRFLGAHQVRNVALAAAGVLALRRRGAIARDPDLAEGAARATLPGRFQVLPAAGGEPLVVLDTGHNPEALAATLDTFEALLPGVRPTVVLGLLSDKRLGRSSDRLLGLARELILTAPAVERAWDVAAAARRLPRRRGLARVHAAPHVADALELAFGVAAGPVLVLGSHYLLGEAVPLLAARRGVTAESLLYPTGDEPLRAAS